METIPALVIAALAALFISLPFFLGSGRENPGSEQGSLDPDPVLEKIKTLEGRKESLLSAIKDIEFDYGLGKLSWEDFEELRDKYKVEAASALREMDILISKSGNIMTDEDLEKEISAERKLLLSDYEDEEIEKEILRAREAAWQMDKDRLVCRKCGNEGVQGDLFCSKCGAKIKGDAENKQATTF
ncbi:MAG: zinc ribbon domain-containing protein [Deltaproteobacteria bacterium]